MTDRLHDLLPSLEKLPPELQEEMASYIEALIETLQHTSIDRTHFKNQSVQEQKAWQDPFGAWNDLPDTMLDELNQLRHSNPPTPPVEQL